MRDNRALLGEPLDVFGLLFKVADGNEKREVGVDVPCVFKHLVERGLHIFPKGISPRLDYHAAADGTVFSQVRRLDYLLIPFGIILLPRGLDCGSFLLCHKKIFDGKF